MDAFDCFSDIFCINLNSAAERWQAMQLRFHALDIARRVQRFPAISTPGNHHIGCALSHRSIIEQAAQNGKASVLVFEDDALFLDRTLEVMAQASVELAQIDWNLCYLGAATWADEELPLLESRRFWVQANKVTCTHAIAYHERVYERLLQALPADVPGMSDWLKQHQGIDQYLRGMDKAVLIRPVLATQPYLLPFENPADQFHFTI